MLALTSDLEETDKNPLIYVTNKRNYELICSAHVPAWLRFPTEVKRFISVAYCRSGETYQQILECLSFQTLGDVTLLTVDLIRGCTSIRLHSEERFISAVFVQNSQHKT